ncbi:MAG: Uma2 family endonuclease [Clostridia bacterium]|nr:MAG: Uma2 family endonuclease [Clostridia bacterium]
MPHVPQMATKDRMTVADYKRLPEGAPYQLVGGEFVLTPAPRPLHQVVSGRIFRLISGYIEDRRLGVVLYAPVDVYLGEEDAYQPDLLYISAERQNLITEDGVHGAPDLVIEILSPATAYYDLRTKFRAYRESGVREYWVVDPGEKVVEVYSNHGGHFATLGSFKKHDKLVSQVLSGLEIEVSDIFS